MTRLKAIKNGLKTLVLCVAIALCGLFFVACDPSGYSSISLSVDSSSITIDVDQEESLLFTINGYTSSMSSKLNISITGDSSLIYYEQYTLGDGVTSVNVTGKSGGSLTLTATTIDGGVSCSVKIVVQEYSSSLENSDSSLYVTENTSLLPSAADFVFDDSSTVRDLSYYFYGRHSADDLDLTLDDIMQNDEFYGEFVSISLYSYNEELYLLLENSSGEIFTVANATVDVTQNTKLSLTQIDDLDTFNFSNSLEVSMGDSFDFVAVYNVGDDQLFVTRRFYVLETLNSENISYSYSYSGEQTTRSGSIMLVPNRQGSVDYKKVNLMLSCSQNSDYVLYGYTGSEYVNILRDTTADGLSLTISSNCTTTVYSTLKVKVYYDGFEDAGDDVCVEIEIAVDIVYEPETLLVNGVVEGAVTYQFYNNYSGSNVGWQAFVLSTTPTTAPIDYVTITYENSDVQVMYKSQTYTTGTVTIYDLSVPVYIKGVTNEENLGSGIVTFTVYYTTISQGNLSYTITYNIVAGAKDIAYDDETFSSGIYVDLDGGEVTFSGLYADATFSSISYTFVSDEGSEDVVSFVDCEQSVTESDGKYYLNFKIKPKAVGTGYYKIVLDNGTTKQITIKVVEGLTSELQFTFASSSTEVTVLSPTAQVGEKDEEGYTPASATIYISNTSSYGVEVLAIVSVNGRSSSDAIVSGSFTRTGSGFSASDEIDGAVRLTITTNADGYGYITYSIIGQVVEDFKISSKTVEFVVYVTSYSSVGRISVIKLSDGEGDYEESDAVSAAITTVYSGSVSDTKKTATFAVKTTYSGYFFYNPVSGEFENSVFSNQYVYWTCSKSSVTMIYDPSASSNIYTISGAGTFNTQTMTFVSSTSDVSLTLTAHVRQYDQTFSYTVTIRSQSYQEVTSISMQDASSSEPTLTFSASKTQVELIVFTAPTDATSSSITLIYQPGSLDGNPIYLLGEANSGTIDVSLNENVSCKEVSSGTYVITLTISSDFLSSSQASSDADLTGKLLVVADDWISGGSVLSQYSANVLYVTLNYANGTENAPYVIEDADDLLAISNAPSAYYTLSTTIDLSGVDISSWNIGEFSGVLTGSNNASITGINITTGADGYYGLFSEVSGTISNVAFSGSINISATESVVYVGLIAGRNSGTLSNVGVTLDDSTITICANNGTYYVGCVVGVNEGLILQNYQDYTSTTPNVLVNNGSATFTIISDGSNSLSSYTNNNSGKLFAGGVTGSNTGKIYKVDNENLSLYGYSNYLVYANILVSGFNFSNVGGVAGYCSGEIVGYRTVTDSGEYVKYASTTATENAYSAGLGIIVGGQLVNQSLYTVQNANDNSYLEYDGGIVGVLTTAVIGETFTGITARMSVMGSLYVGAISGQTSSNLSANLTLYPANLLVQATDEGFTGLQSSFVTKVLPSNYSSLNLNRVSTDADYIAFGSFSGVSAYGLMSYGTDGTMTSFVTRSVLSVDTQNKTTTVSDISSDEYYGDFVITNGVSQGSSVILANATFEKDTTSISITNSSAYASLTGGSESVYYLYYFNATGFAYDSSAEGAAEAQELLDEYLNVYTSTSSLYPFVLSDEMILTSLSSSILSVDITGKITVYQSGPAKIRVSSVLNKSTTKEIYVYVVNYFSNEETSIVYPSISRDSEALSNSTITLKGSSSLSLYITPSQLTEDGQTYDGNSYSIDSDGLLSIGGTNITLASCDDITATVKVYKDGALVGGTVVSNPEVDVIVSGQIITFISNSSTLDTVTYDVEITPILSVSINSVAYTANVNKTLSDIDLKYVKGATKLSNNYDSISINSSSKIVDEIYVTSGLEEVVPYYAILKDGSTLYNNYLNVGTLYEQYAAGDGLISIEIVSKGGNKFSLTITINKYSEQYQNRYDEDIYGDYTLVLYAESDITVFKTIEITFEKVFAQTITVDNYTSLSDINTSGAYTTSSGVSNPGEQGLLVVTITPGDSDYDYITIENDEVCYEDGSGIATFAIVAKSASGSLEFSNTTITGETTSTGTKFKLSDIISAYDDAAYADYNGVVYISYIIGTKGVVEGATAKFNITVSDSAGTTSTSKTLELKLAYTATATLVDKEADESGTYTVARGLSYEISLDNRWGFSLDQLTVTVSDSSLASISQVSGTYYLTITSDVISYNGSAKTFNIIVQGYAEEGSLVRESVTYTPVRVMEYVVNYDFETVGNADIVYEMDGGQINVLIGNKQSLSIDMIDYIEYDETIYSVVSEVEEFMQSLTSTGVWTVYTNIDESGINTNYTITTSTFKTKAVLQSGVALNNIYFQSTYLDITPIMTHSPNTVYYMFSYESNIVASATTGIYTVNSEGSGTKVYTEFVFNVFQSTSEESPIPIDNYTDFMNMEDNQHYILISDITLVSGDAEDAFTPLSASIASLDGNGYTIYYSGTYDFGEESELGLFSTISADTVIKNVTIELTSDTTFVTSSDAFTAGLLAATNSGIVTNCEVVGGYDESTSSRCYFSVTSSNLAGDSYVCALVATNSGYITNSRSSVNIETTFNASGFVGTNSGTIASSYFAGGEIINKTQNDHYTSGFVISNEDTAQILTSYVSGDVTSGLLFSYLPSSGSYSGSSHRDVSRIYSSGNQAGFVYNNAGTINDCYSNINMFGNFMSGFVYNNGGDIENSFSTSVLVNKLTSSAGFAMNNTYDDVTGAFENCYYFYNDTSYDYDGETYGFYNTADVADNINTSIEVKDFTGISRLNKAGFEDVAENFSSYGYSTTNRATNSVWFYSTGSTKSDDYGADTVFASGRLELVAANLIASPSRTFIGTTVDATTGEKTYNYTYNTSLGSAENPYLIKSAEEFETYILEGNTSSNENSKNYRLVCDIDYSDYDGINSTYVTTFSGRLEGNGMTISSIILASTDNLTYAGLFKQIGRSGYAGYVANLTIVPTTVAFTNTEVVGTLAGFMSNGYIYNISVVRDDDDNDVVVSGKNIVGGVVGLASGVYKVFNITTNISVAANYLPADTTSMPVNSYELTSYGNSYYSYAGAAIGYATGSGVIQNIEVEDCFTVMGAYAGFAIGGLGVNATASNIDVVVEDGCYVKAYYYGGMAFGEIRGNVSNVSVSGTSGQLSVFSLFSSQVANAVGGVVGIMYGGTISGASMTQGFTVGGISSSTGTKMYVSSVGGIAGMVNSATAYFEQCYVDGDITTTTTLGGLVGTANVAVFASEIAISSTAFTLYGSNTTAILGGIIGDINDVYVNISDSYVTTDFTVYNYVYGADNNCYIGHFVGKGAITTMSRAYSTSLMTITLQDMRSGDDPTAIYGSYSEANTTAAGTLEGVSVSYTRQYDTTLYNDVYYWGTVPNADATAVISGNSAISVRASRSLGAVNLVINTYGLTQEEYSGYASGVSTTSAASIFAQLFNYYTDGTNVYRYVSSTNAYYIVGSTTYYQYNATADAYTLGGEVDGTVFNTSALYECYVDGSNYYYYNSLTNYYHLVGSSVSISADNATSLKKISSLWACGENTLPYLAFEDEL